jgi:uncharacterized protein (AIM24 family)
MIKQKLLGKTIFTNTFKKEEYLVCKPTCLMAAISGAAFDITVRVNATSLLNGENITFEKISGSCAVFIGSIGTITEFHVGEGDSLLVSSDLILAYTSNVVVGTGVSSVKSWLLGGVS